MDSGSVARFFRNKRILITGGLGFIGSNVAYRLVEFGAKITIVDALIPEYGGSFFNISGIKDRVKVVIGDVRNAKKMESLIKGMDFLFNLAGQTSHLDSMMNPFTDLEINCLAQLSILEVCRKYNPKIRIVFASTRQVYGKPDYLPVNEDHLLRPVDVNGVNKMAGEWYHILYNNVYGIKTAVLRLTNTFGPRMRIKDARQTFLGVWIRFLLENRAFEVWGGEQLRDFDYVDDVVKALLLVATKEAACGQIFNLGGSGKISLKELADLLIDLNGNGKYLVKNFPRERKKIDIGDYYSDFHKINKSLGWKPEISLRVGLIRTLDYYRKYLNKYI